MEQLGEHHELKRTFEVMKLQVLVEHANQHCTRVRVIFLGRQQLDVQVCAHPLDFNAPHLNSPQ